MNPSDLFRKAVYSLLKEKKIKQLKLARLLKVSPPNLNDFLRGGRNYSDKKKEKIAEILGTTYVDMLQLGRKLVGEEHPPPAKANKITVTLPHTEIINQFEDKETARELNQMLVALERRDPDKYKQARTYVQALYDTLPEKKIING